MQAQTFNCIIMETDDTKRRREEVGLKLNQVYSLVSTSQINFFFFFFTDSEFFFF